MSALSEMVTSYTSSALNMEVFQSLAMEIVIFCATMVVVVVAKVRGGLAASKASKSKALDRDLSECQQSLLKAPPIKPEPPERETRNRKVTPQGPPNIVDTIMERTSIKSGNAEQALALYAEMRSSGQHLQIKDLARDSKRFSAIDFYSAMLQTAVRAGQPQLVQELLDDMTTANVERSLSFYESAMKVLSSKKHYQEALHVYNRLTAEGLKASPVTLSCLINFTAELGDFDRALAFFEQLSSIATPSIRAYMTALRVHSKRQDWQSSLRILRSMQERGVQVDNLVLNTVLSTGVSAGKTEAAEALLHEMAGTNSGIVDAISYNTLLKGYAHQKTADKALMVLRLMLDRGVKASGVTFNTVMDAAIRCSQVQEAFKVLEQMQEAGIQPDKYTCTILMKGLHEESTPKQLSKVLDMLQLALPQCDSTLRSTLFHGIIQVAARLSNMSLMMRAFFQMQQLHVLPTANDHQMMIVALAQQGHTSDCKVVWQSLLAPARGSCQHQDRMDAAATMFTTVMDDLAKREKIEGMLCAFESLSDALMVGPASSQKSCEDKVSSLLQQCRAALLQAASRRKDSNPAFRRLLELAPEYGLPLEIAKEH